MLTKTDLAEKLSKRLVLTKAAGNAAINLVIQEIANELISGGTVRLSGIGTLRISERQERMASNPQTGEKIKVPAYKTVVLKCSRTLKDTMNGR